MYRKFKKTAALNGMLLFFLGWIDSRMKEPARTLCLVGAQRIRAQKVLYCVVQRIR